MPPIFGIVAGTCTGGELVGELARRRRVSSSVDATVRSAAPASSARTSRIVVSGTRGGDRVDGDVDVAAVAVSPRT